MAAAMTLPAEAALEQAPTLLAEVDAALAAADSDAVFQLDASALSSIDTSTIALLLHAKRGAAARGLGLQVLAAPPKLRELAQLYGVEELLPLGEPPVAT